MITIALSAISLALAASTPTAAEPIPAPAAPVATAAKTDGAAPTRYCVQGVPTGSILRQKVCKTRSEWKDEGFDPLARK